MTGAITYNVEYDKGNGKTKASNIYNKDGEIKLLGEEYGEFDMEDAGPDYNSISDLEDELRRLIRFSNQYGSKGADAKIEQLKQRIAQLKNQVNEAKKVKMTKKDLKEVIREQIKSLTK
jgi:ABC-type Fe3+-hydroxamate transport system substrate-binding protein